MTCPRPHIQEGAELQFLSFCLPSESHIVLLLLHPLGDLSVCVTEKHPDGAREPQRSHLVTQEASAAIPAACRGHARPGASDARGRRLQRCPGQREARVPGDHGHGSVDKQEQSQVVKWGLETSQPILKPMVGLLIHEKNEYF